MAILNGKFIPEMTRVGAIVCMDSGARHILRLDAWEIEQVDKMLTAERGWNTFYDGESHLRINVSRVESFYFYEMDPE